MVIYSMASSRAKDAPRGVGFVHDLHRLNVAVSRAQAMTMVVPSPRLLEAPVHTPEQLRRVNALCRLVSSTPQILRTQARSQDQDGNRPIPATPRADAKSPIRVGLGGAQWPPRQTRGEAQCACPQARSSRGLTRPHRAG